MPRLNFTREADRDEILPQYTTTFNELISEANELQWNRLGWDYEMQELMPALLATKHLVHLNLSYNKLRGVVRACYQVDKTSL